MHSEANRQLIIKEKADFIYFNSGIILSKLNNEFLKKDVENNLQILLLYDTNLNDYPNEKYSLISKTCDAKFPNNYESAIRIIFHLANLINTSAFHEDGKLRLRNKLREFPKYFECSKEDLEVNKKYVRLYEKN